MTDAVFNKVIKAKQPDTKQPEERSEVPGQASIDPEAQRFGARRNSRNLIILILLVIPAIYLLTMARKPVFGDPTEYTFVANILGIAHPPGYAFITLLGKAFQTLIPVGQISWRMHLLSVTAATVALFFVYGTVLTVASQNPFVTRTPRRASQVVALFAALVVGLAADWWQHAIHANPHIITATFLAANLFFLTKWWASAANQTNAVDRVAPAERNDNWLLAFSFSAGLGITHHPLTIFSFPAFALFIIVVEPNIWRDWRTWLKMLALFLLGLAVLLYYPLRSAMAPAFGPADMNTLEGFLDHVLARGLSESLPFFGLADQFDRATVFWTLLGLQYALPIIFLAVVGWLWLLWDPTRHRDSARHPGNTNRSLALLFGFVFVANYLFVINLRAQDIMAYLLGIFMLLGLLAGIGLWGVLELLGRRLWLDTKALALLLGAVFLLGPLLELVRNLPKISLQDYEEAAVYVEAVFDFFEGQNEGAILLNDWEHMTPLWYEQFVEGHWPLPEDVTPILVATKRPWLESVFYYLPKDPVYLSGYRSEVVGAGFRLRPRGLLYQVVQPGDTTIPPELTKIEPVTDDAIEIVAYDLPQVEAEAGDYLPLTLAMRTQQGTDDYFVPVVRFGQGQDQIVYEFTTDSHLITPLWQPGEVIVERFDVALPQDLDPGTYPIHIDLRNLSSMEDIPLDLYLGEVTIRNGGRAQSLLRLLANFRQQVGLVSATARTGLIERRQAPWQEPLVAKRGETIHLTLDWLSLAPSEESYTVFVHLIDLNNRPLVTLDYTPLGGATPTHLWIPKWLPGQRMLDPYRLKLPEDLDPGTYLIEVGLYEMTSRRRLHIADEAGNLVGDRYILGAVQIEE